MSMSICGPIHDPFVEFPDLETGCCYGSIMGPDRCTCWEPVYDIEQSDPNLFDAPEPRAEPCADCAFRSDSPESRGDERYQSYEFTPTQPFYCHQGMRRIVAYRHPSGAKVAAAVQDRWSPPERDGIVYKANGMAGDICAGWWSRARRTPEALPVALAILNASQSAVPMEDGDGD